MLIDRLRRRRPGMAAVRMRSLRIARRLGYQVEALWALAWSLQIVPTMDFSRECSESFIRLVPNLKLDESSQTLRKKASLRAAEEIIAAVDLAYCLHWAVVEAALRGAPPGGKVAPYVIVERRRALEWLVSSDDWDDLVLDT